MSHIAPFLSSLHGFIFSSSSTAPAEAHVSCILLSGAPQRPCVYFVIYCIPMYLLGCRRYKKFFPINARNSSLV